MVKVTFYKPNKIVDQNLRFAVIAARCGEKWVFCRHKQRSTWEIPGGHREEGETVLQTAHRELYEETGARATQMNAVAAYGVKQDGVETYGMLYFAEVPELGKLPEDSEIGEVKLFDALPEVLTYPLIQKDLYYGVQNWRNLQTSAGELWDVYDADRNLTGKLHRRGEFMEEGEYHLAVHVWLVNSRGECLITKRSPNKGFPNMWECTGGSAIAGDDSLTAALREVKEETGLTVNPNCGECVYSYRRADNFVDIWVFHQDFDIADVVLQEGETCDKMYASIPCIRELIGKGQFVPYSYLDVILKLLSE